MECDTRPGECPPEPPHRVHRQPKNFEHDHRVASEEHDRFYVEERDSAMNRMGDRRGSPHSQAGLPHRGEGFADPRIEVHQADNNSGQEYSVAGDVTRPAVHGQ